MKNLLFIFLLLSNINSFSQTHWLGFAGGYDHSIWCSSTTGQFKSGNCFNIGMTYKAQFKKYFALETQLLYQKRGYKNIADVIINDDNGDPVGGTPYADYHYKYNYLSFPIKVSFSVGKRYSGFINLGLVPSTLLLAKANIDYHGSLESNPSSKNNISKGASQFDLGSQIDIGLGIYLTRSVRFSLSLGYYFSFFKGQHPKVIDGYEIYHSNYKSHNLSFQVGFHFVLNRRGTWNRFKTEE